MLTPIVLLLKTPANYAAARAFYRVTHQNEIQIQLGSGAQTLGQGFVGVELMASYPQLALRRVLRGNSSVLTCRPRVLTSTSKSKQTFTKWS